MNQQRTMPSFILVLFLLAFPVLSVLTGCVAWQPDWPADAVSADPPETRRLLQEADRLAALAVDQEGLQAAMDAYARVLDRASYHPWALTELANQTILMGSAHTQGREDKNRHFVRAMRLCERAMYADPDFRGLVNQGKTPWEACHVLDGPYMPAMMFWSTAVLYRFKEVLTFPEQVVNLAWVEHTGPFLDRMEALDPDWGGGAIHFTRSLYLGILPRAMGGDDEMSAQQLEKAVSYGAPWMLSRWGRAKYFHVRDGNRQGFEEDMRWVLTQDVAAPAEALCWRTYFHRDARESLDRVDDFF